MNNSKVKSLFCRNQSKSFSFKKKFCAAFIFACMCVNGFAHSTVEISRYSFVFVFAAVSQNIAVQLFSKCGDSLLSASSKVCIDLSKTLFPALSDSEGAPVGSGSGNKTSKNNTNNYAVIKTSSLSDKRLLSDSQEKSVLFVPLRDVSVLYYKNFRVPGSAAGGCIVILFLVLLLAVRQKKFDDIIDFSMQKALNNRFRKAKISA